MTAYTASQIPLGVRIRNARYDGMITGWLHEAPSFSEADPGGMTAASFVVDQRNGARSDIFQPYSRVYIFDKRTGDTVFEGDTTHPGRSFGADGNLLQVNVDGPVTRLEDWSGKRIYCDSDMTAWERSFNSTVSATNEAGEDRGGSGEDALTLAFPMNQHVETNHRSEVGYKRIRDAGQTLGRINYRFDAGQNSTSPGWFVRLIATAPSVVARATGLLLAGQPLSAAYVGPSWASTANVAYLQLIWTGGTSSTGTAGNDIVWASLMDVTVVAALFLKDGTARTGAAHNDYVTAQQVWEDMLGDPLLLANTFDGPGAQLDAGDLYQFTQLAFPDGITPLGIAQALMQMEPDCTFLTGASDPVTDKYSVIWLDRPTKVRYECVVWEDDIDASPQAVEQYNRAVTRYQSKVGDIRQTITSQAIPEMDAVGRVRTKYTDLGDISGDVPGALATNAAVLKNHRFPQNGGRVSISRSIVDLFTGRTVEPWEIKPAYLMRIVGANPAPDALNATASNGSTVCRIVNKSYDGASGTATLDLDAQPWGVVQAIKATQPSRPGPYPSRVFPVPRPVYPSRVFPVGKPGMPSRVG